jgi:hypothetical protein
MQCSQFNDADSIAALQAIAVYLLLRFAEEDEDVTNFDVPLIDTMVVRTPPVMFTWSFL